MQILFCKLLESMLYVSEKTSTKIAEALLEGWDLDYENSGFEIKGFRLVEGINGLFVSMPSRKGTDENGNDKGFDTVWIESNNQREELNTLALNEFNNSGSSDMPSNNQADVTTGENIKSDIRYDTQTIKHLIFCR